MSKLSPEAMERITKEPDLVIRNLRITQAYFELSQALTNWTDSSANWCTFATWASKQAGQTIRGEDLQRTFERLFNMSPDLGDAIGQVVTQLLAMDIPLDGGDERERILYAIDPAAAFARAGAAVSRGNTKVFAELGPLFARFAVEFAGDAAPHDERLAAFLLALRPGDPPDGQDRLKEALMAYYEARLTPDPSQKFQLILLGNLLIGSHEQIRLQPEILAAMNASLSDCDEWRARVMAAVAPGFRLRLHHRVSHALGLKLPLDMAVDRLVNQVQRLVRKAITEGMMTLALPGGKVLQLGCDLVADFPPELRSLTLSRLLALLAEIDPTTDSPAESGAVDWSNLADRMHFIADLFRCYGLAVMMLDAPFSAEQVRALAEGRRADGRL